MIRARHSQGSMEHETNIKLVVFAYIPPLDQKIGIFKAW